MKEIVKPSLKPFIPKYDEDAVMMHWSNTAIKVKAPKYNEDAVMMHWSNTTNKYEC